MSTDRTARITALIRKVFDHARVFSMRDEMPCATFQVVGLDDAWAQVTPTELNVAYPLSGPPEDELGEIVRELPGAQLLSWEPNEFATWSFASSNPADVAKVVDLVLAKLFDLGDYAVDGEMETL